MKRTVFSVFAIIAIFLTLAVTDAAIAGVMVRHNASPMADNFVAGTDNNRVMRLEITSDEMVEIQRIRISQEIDSCNRSVDAIRLWHHDIGFVFFEGNFEDGHTDFDLTEEDEPFIIGRNSSQIIYIEVSLNEINENQAGSGDILWFFFDPEGFVAVNANDEQVGMDEEFHMCFSSQFRVLETVPDFTTLELPDELLQNGWNMIFRAELSCQEGGNYEHYQLPLMIRKTDGVMIEERFTLSEFQLSTDGNNLRPGEDFEIVTPGGGRLDDDVVMEAGFQLCWIRFLNMLILEPNNPVVIEISTLAENVGSGGGQDGVMAFFVNTHLLRGQDEPLVGNFAELQDQYYIGSDMSDPEHGRESNDWHNGWEFDGVGSEYANVLVSEWQPLQLRHFDDFHQSNENHSLLIEEITIDRRSLPSFWEIGVFTPDGILAGAGVWFENEQLGISVWGDDPMTEEVDGFREGENIFGGILLWDPEEDQEYEVQLAAARGENIWEADGLLIITRIQITSDRVEINLPRGWNMVSVNVIPGYDQYYDGDEELPSVERMLINRYVILVKDGDGRFCYQPDHFNNIPYWDVTQGYQVYVDEVNTAATIFGRSIPADTDIPLEEGWNMIAYFPDFQLNAPVAFDELGENLIMAKDGDGNFYLPGWNFCNMGLMRPSKGYKVKVNEAAVLNYPAEQEDEVNSTEKPICQHYGSPQQTDNNMSILFTDCVSGSEYAAFNEAGVLIGSGATGVDGNCGFAIWGDDLSTDEIEGAVEGKIVTFKIWGSEEKLPVSVKYKTDGLEVIGVPLGSEPVEFKLDEAYPNPFNSVTRLAYGLPEAGNVSVKVFDISGRQVADLFDENQSVGRHSVSWDAEGFSAGLYFISLEANGHTLNQKVILVK